jgi:hypothetical protein
MAEIQKRLLELYHSAINWSGDEARSLILAVLTHQLLDANLPLPNTNKTLKGLFQPALFDLLKSGHFVPATAFFCRSYRSCFAA